MTDDASRDDEHVVPAPNAPEDIEGGPDRQHDAVAHAHFENDMQMDEPEIRGAPDAGGIHWHAQHEGGVAEDRDEVGGNAPA